MSTSRGFTFTSSHGMVDGIHGYTANSGATPQMAFRTGLTQGYVGLIFIAHLTNCRHTFNVNHAHFTGRQAKRGVFPFPSLQLRGTTRPADELTSLTPTQLDIVYHQSNRNRFEWQGIAGTDIGFGTGQDPIADVKPVGCDDVAFFAINIVQQGDTSRAVGIVFDRGDLSRDAGFIPTKIDDAIGPLVPATTMTNRNPAVTVATATFLERSTQGLFSGFFSQIAVIQLDHEAPARRIGFIFLYSHY